MPVGCRYSSAGVVGRRIYTGTIGRTTTTVSYCSIINRWRRMGKKIVTLDGNVRTIEI